VEAGSTAILHFTASNPTSVPLVVPAIAVQGDGFLLAGTSVSGSVLQPQQQAAFDVQFAPVATGTCTAELTIGERTYPLTGIATAPPPPGLQISIQLPQAAAGQQGTVTLHLNGAVAAGNGTLKMTFQPAIAGAADPAIGFAAGGQTLGFIFTAGDTEAHFGGQTAAPFQAGTTAGTLVFTADAGGAPVSQTVALGPQAVSVNAVQAARASSSVSVQVTGFDNTRTAGALVFTFYDAVGNSIVPGGIASNNAKEFSTYFAGSPLGGVFLLDAQFPVSGDAAQIRSVDVQFNNSAGASKSQRISF
jgi:hypothetical protein